MNRRTIRATLIGDGASDRVLVHVLHWVFAELGVFAETQYADLGILSRVPSGIRARARAALELFPADILFIHRDAEGEPAAHRYAEILRALDVFRDFEAAAREACGRVSRDVSATRQSDPE